MTIDLYPEIIRQEDLSPDSGFGGDIDEDCQVRQRVVVVMFCRKRSGLLIFVCFCCCPFFLSYFFFFFCSSNTKHTHTQGHSRCHQGLGCQRPKGHWFVGDQGRFGSLHAFQTIRRALRKQVGGHYEKGIPWWFWIGHGILGHAIARSRMLHDQKGNRRNRSLDQNFVLYVVFFVFCCCYCCCCCCCFVGCSRHSSIHTCIHPHKHTYICISMVAHAFCFLSIVIRKTTTNL